MSTTYIYTRVSQDEAVYVCCGQQYEVHFGKHVSCSVCGCQIDTSKPPERVGDQLKDCEKYCSAFDLPGPRVHVWEVTSAASTKMRDRPNGRRMMMTLKRGDHVVVAKLDRAFRSMSDMCAVTDEWERKGVTLHIVNMRVDTSTASGKLMLQMVTAFAEFEVQVQSDRRKLRAKHLKDNGYSTGNVPFGYRVDVVTEGGRRKKVRVPDEKERDLLRKLLELHAKRYSRASILQHIDACGWKSRSGVSYQPTYIRKLLLLAMDWRDSDWSEEVLLRGFKNRKKKG